MMKLIIGILVIGLVIGFVFVLQKWRKSIKESISSLETIESKRRKNGIGFLIDVFSLGFIGMAVLMVYFMINS